MEETIENTEETFNDWSNSPTVTDLAQTIEDADQDAINHRTNVTSWLDIRNGTNKPKAIKGRSSVVPLTVRKANEWRYAPLEYPFLSVPDIYKVAPTSAGDRKRANQNALILNKQFNTQMGKVKFIQDMVRECVDIGTAVIEVGWKTVEEEVSSEEPVYEYEPVNDPQAMQQVAQQYIGMLQTRAEKGEDLFRQFLHPGMIKAVEIFEQTGQLVIPRQTGTQTVTKMVETINQPTLEICESANIIVDPTCNGDYTKAQFIGRKHVSSIAKLKKDGKYKNLDRIQSSESPSNNPDIEVSQDWGNFEFITDSQKELTVYTYWGYWDVEDDGVLVPIVSSWIGSTLIRQEKNPYPFKRPPYVMISYMPVRKSVYGQPDAELLGDTQKVIGAVTRGVLDLMSKSANAQRGTQKGALDAINRKKFDEGRDYEFNPINGDPRSFHHMHTYGEIPASAFNVLSMQNAEAESLSGVKAFTSGINSKALGDSVGGGRDAMDAASKRESGILTRIAAGILDIGRMVMAMNSIFLSEEEVVRITDEEFVTVRRDDLAGNFDLELTISTMEQDEKKAAELAFMLQTTGPSDDPGERRLIRAEIARLRKMPDLAQRIEDYRPEPDPMEVRKAEMEMELMQSQILKEQALANKHNAEAHATGYRGMKDGSQAELNMSKVGTEGAKGRNLHSMSDQMDQDYVEKATGADHAKEIEKVDRKSKNDLESKLIESQLNTNKENN